MVHNVDVMPYLLKWRKNVTQVRFFWDTVGHKTKVWNFTLRPKLNLIIYKSSALAEMDDHFATIDMGRKLGWGLCPFWEGSSVPM